MPQFHAIPRLKKLTNLFMCLLGNESPLSSWSSYVPPVLLEAKATVMLDKAQYSILSVLFVFGSTKV